MKRKSRILAVLLAVMLVFSACGKQEPAKTEEAPATEEVAKEEATQEPTQEPVSEEAEEPVGNPDTLTIAITKDENTLTPITYVTGSPGFDTMKFMYDSLFTVSAENEVIPWMIEEDYEINDDFTEFKMTLKDGQQWHDGTELTAEDVIFTFEYFKDSFTHSRWTPIASKVKAASAEGNVITLTLEEPDPGFLRASLADMRIVPKSEFEGVEDPTTLPNMGSGAYKLVEYKTGESYTLEAMDNYFRGTPKVKTIQMPIIADPAVIQQALIAGEIATSTSSIGPELVETFMAAPNIEVEKSEGYASTLLIMDNEKAPFDNADFRLAVSEAINIDELVEQVCLGYAEKGSSGYVKKGMDEYVEGLDHVFDVDKANELLDSIGYTDKDDAGMRKGLDGQEMNLELLAAASSPQRIRTAEIIVQQLEKIGIKATVNSMDSDAVTELVWPEFETAADRSYDMAIFGWSAPVIQKAGAIIAVCSSDFAGVGGQNLSHYKNAEFDALAAEFLQTVDAAKRAELNAEMQKIAAVEAPMVTLFFGDTICAVNTQMYDGWVFAKGTTAVNLFSFLDS